MRNIIHRKTDMKNWWRKVQAYEAACSWAQPKNAKITDHFLAFDQIDNLPGKCNRWLFLHPFSSWNFSLSFKGVNFGLQHRYQKSNTINSFDVMTAVGIGGHISQNCHNLVFGKKCGKRWSVYSFDECFRSSWKVILKKQIYYFFNHFFSKFD